MEVGDLPIHAEHAGCGRRGLSVGLSMGLPMHLPMTAPGGTKQ